MRSGPKSDCSRPSLYAFPCREHHDFVPFQGRLSIKEVEQGKELRTALRSSGLHYPTVPCHAQKR